MIVDYCMYFNFFLLFSVIMHIINHIQVCGGISSVGRASDCGSEGRGFDPHIPPQKFKFLIDICNLFFIIIALSRGVAQLVAYSLWERGVVSSSLAAPTI